LNWAAARSARVMVSGSHPVEMAKDQAAVALPPLIRYIAARAGWLEYQTYNPDIALAAADLLAPYLLPVLRSTPDGFDLTADERRATLRLLVDDERAFKRILESRDRLLAGVELSPTADHLEVLSALRDVSELLGLVDMMSRHAAVAEGERALETWGLLWTAVGAVVSLVPGGSEVNAAVGAATKGVHSLLDRLGVGPDTIDEVRHRSLRNFDTVTALGASTVVAAAFDRLVRSGTIGVEVPTPPLPDVEADNVGMAYTVAFEDWLERSGFDDATASWLSAVKNAVSSPHESAANATGALLD